MRRIRMVAGSVWTVVGLAGLSAGPACGQTKIPPSHLYSSQPPAGLDKDYGLPKSALPGPDSPPQKATAAKPREEPDSFDGLSTFARPETQPSDTPDFFRASPGLSSPEAQTSDVPNFFQASPDSGLPSVAKSQSGYSTTDTSLFTTTDGSPTGDSPFDDTTTGDAAALDGAKTR